MTKDTNEVERIIEVVTREVLIALAEQEHDHEHVHGDHCSVESISHTELKGRGGDHRRQDLERPDQSNRRERLGRN